MKITLTRRHYGIHDLVKEVEVPGEFSDYATPPADPRDDHAVQEDKLLSALPEDFLPVPAKQVLLVVCDDIGGTGQRGLTQFRNWAKYFDAYALNLWPEGTAL